MFKALNNQQNTNFINKMHITYFTSFKNQWDLKHCRILIGSNFFFSDTQNDAPVNGYLDFHEMWPTSILRIKVFNTERKPCISLHR